MVERISTKFGPFGRVVNGAFGFLTSIPRITPIKHFVPSLFESGQLLNPVVGMRMDTLKPTLTVGALDPNDYEGEINWVPLESSNLTDNLYNQFKVDGIVGRNGSLVPYGDNLVAGITSRPFSSFHFPSNCMMTSCPVFMGLAVPDNFTYINNTGFSGPLFNDTLNLEPDTGALGIPCRDSDQQWGPGVHVPPAYLELSVQINGVKYMIENSDLVRNATFNLSPEGYCHIALSTNGVPGKPDIWLGMPFLRSVYLLVQF